MQQLVLCAFSVCVCVVFALDTVVRCAVCGVVHFFWGFVRWVFVRYWCIRESVCVCETETVKKIGTARNKTRKAVFSDFDSVCV
jgi:hypothetical protein